MICQKFWKLIEPNIMYQVAVWIVRNNYLWQLLTFKVCFHSCDDLWRINKSQLCFLWKSKQKQVTSKKSASKKEIWAFADRKYITTSHGIFLGKSPKINECMELRGATLQWQEINRTLDVLKDFEILCVIQIYFQKWYQYISLHITLLLYDISLFFGIWDIHNVQYPKAPYEFSYFSGFLWKGVIWREI